MRTISALAVALALTMMVVGCGSGSSSPGASGSGRSASTSGKRVKVAMFLIGYKNDKSFDEGAYNGVLAAAKKFPQIQLTAVLENRTTEQQDTDAITSLAQSNDIVIGVGGLSGPAIDLEASSFPHTTFLTIQGTNPAHYHKNVYSVVWDPLAPFVSGTVAARLTKHDVVGFIGGADIPSTTKSGLAFKDGVRRANPRIRVLTNIIGSFNDAAGAKSATTAMLNSGADVIYPFLDAGVVGTFAAATSAHDLIPIFKIDYPQCNLYANTVGTDILEDTETGTSRLLEGVVGGTLKPAGVAIFVGLQDPRLQRMVLCPRYARNREVVDIVRNTVAGVNSGKIKVPAGVRFPRPHYPYREGFSGRVVNAG